MSDAQLGLLTAPHHHRLCRYAEGDGRPVHHGDRIRRRAVDRYRRGAVHDAVERSGKIYTENSVVSHLIR